MRKGKLIPERIKGDKWSRDRQIQSLAKQHGILLRSLAKNPPPEIENSTLGAAPQSA